MHKLRFTILFIICFKALYLYSCANSLLPTNPLTNPIHQNNKDSFVQKNNIQLSVKHDTINYRAIIFLSINDSLTDSTVIEKVSFDYHSFTKVNDTLWHYIYSQHSPLFKEDGINSYKQIIIEILDKKIHFSYVGTYWYSSLHNKNVSYGYFWDQQYHLNLNDTILGSHLRFKRTTHIIDENDVKIDSSDNIILLNYDSEKRIYYNKIDTLNGIYTFFLSNPSFPQNDFVKVHINNEVVLSIEPYFYYKGKWFILSGLKEYSQSIYPFQNIDENWLSR